MQLLELAQPDVKRDATTSTRHDFTRLECNTNSSVQYPPKDYIAFRQVTSQWEYGEARFQEKSNLLSQREAEPCPDARPNHCLGRDDSD